MHLAWVSGKTEDKQVKLRKPTYKEEVQALADHLTEKWERQDKIEADKIKEAPEWAGALISQK